LVCTIAKEQKPLTKSEKDQGSPYDPRRRVRERMRSGGNVLGKKISICTFK